MALETTHVIKSDDVEATRAVRPDPAVLRGTLKIPSEQVVVESDEEERAESAAHRPIIDKTSARISDAPFEVWTPVPEPEPEQRTEPEEEEEAAEPSIEELEAEWEQRLQEAVNKARVEGIEEGRAAVQEEADTAVSELRETFARQLDGIQQAWEAHLEGAQIRLVRLAFRIASVVLDAPLPDDVRAISEEAVADAIEHMVDDVPVEVALHPVSYLHIQESGLEDQLATLHSKLRWRSDPSLKENEWVVQCDRAAIRRLESELLDELQRELSLRDMGDDARSAPSTPQSGPDSE